MENRNQEVTSFVATFENHYKAMLFKKRMGPVCTLRPVPRCLSSSCGTAAFFVIEKNEDISQELKAFVESIYEFKNGEYNEVYKN